VCVRALKGKQLELSPASVIKNGPYQPTSIVLNSLSIQTCVHCVRVHMVLPVPVFISLSVRVCVCVCARWLNVFVLATTTSSVRFLYIDAPFRDNSTGEKFCRRPTLPPVKRHGD